MRRILFRADGNSKIGYGHVYRLLALTEMLKEDYECVFVINRPPPFLFAEINRKCDVVIDLNKETNYKSPNAILPNEELRFDLQKIIRKNDIVVTDGYLFGEKYQQEVKNIGAKLVCIDDLSKDFFYADAVINHAPGVDESVYRRSDQTAIYSGLEYAILRQVFFQPLSTRRSTDSRAFISLGGSDAERYSLTIARSLFRSGFFSTIDILASSSFSPEWLQQMKDEAPSLHATVHTDLTGVEMVVMLDKCTHGFVAASTVLIESYARGLVCFAGHYANNQRFIYNGFVKEHRAIGLGHFKEWDEQKCIELLSKSSLEYQLKEPIGSTKKIRNIFETLC